MSNFHLVDKSAFVKKYGHLSHLLRMSYEQICRYQNVADVEIFAIIKMQCEVRESYRLSFRQKPFSIYDEEFQNYCFLRLQKLKMEVLLAFFLDEKDRLIQDEIIHIGVSNSVAFEEDTILKRAKFYNAKNLIVVHNHPGGTPYASAADCRSSLVLFSKCKSVGIKCHASLIVAHEMLLNICPENIERLCGSHVF